MNENKNDKEGKGKELINHDEDSDEGSLPEEPDPNISQQEPVGEAVQQVESVVPQPQTCLPDRQASLSAEAAAQAGNIEPQTSTMEVHPPHHVHYNKKFKDYLFEFLMLFFASH